MNKKLVVLLSMVVLLVAGLSVVSAQGRRNRVCDPQQPQDCLNEPQQNAYQYGGMGFVNPQTGAQWNGQQRGQMGRRAGMNGTGIFMGMPPAYEGELPEDKRCKKCKDPFICYCTS